MKFAGANPAINYFYDTDVSNDYNAMKKDIQRYPGIRKIGWLHSTMLPKRIDLRGIVGEVFTIIADITEIPFIGEAEAKVTKEKEGSSYKESAELKFRTHRPITDTRGVAFVITDMQGESYVIGSREEPSAKVRCERTTGTTAGDPDAYQITVTHEAIRTLVKCYST